MPSSLDRVEITLRKVARDSENIYLTTHAEERMFQRGYSRKQVDSCIRIGKIVDGPILDSDMKLGWKMTMESVEAGDMIKVVCKLLELPEGRIIIITVI